MSMRPQLAVAALLAAGGVIAGGVYLWPTGRTIGCGTAVLTPSGQHQLAALAGSIQHEVERSSQGGRSLRWWDPVSGRSRQVSFVRGRINFESGTTLHRSTARFVWIIYPAHAWQSDVLRSPGHSGHSDGAAGISSLYRSKIDNRSARIVALESVDGHDTLHLRERVPFPQPQLPKGFPKPKRHRLPVLHFDTWVDRSTYLPVRTRFSQVGAWSVTDVTWLPRTADNLAKTRVVLPRGFRHIEPKPSTGTASYLTAMTSTATSRCRQS